MDGFIGLLVWSPDVPSYGSFFSVQGTLILLMCFVGAGVVTRLTKIDTSLNFSLNFAAMLAGCVIFKAFAGESLALMQNELVAGAITANFGMTMAGLALLYGYRKSY